MLEELSCCGWDGSFGGFSELRFVMKEKLQSTKPKTRLSQKQKPEIPGIDIPGIYKCNFLAQDSKRLMDGDMLFARMRDNTAQTDCEVYTWVWEGKSLLFFRHPAQGTRQKTKDGKKNEPCTGHKKAE